MSLQIIAAVGKMVASTIFTQIGKYLFKPDPVNIDAILAGQQAIIDLITELDYKSQIREAMNLIYYWTQRMQEVVDDINRTNNSQASLDAYNDVISALRNQSSGVRYQTFVIYNAIMGTTSPLGTDGMLLYWESQAYKKLADRGNFTYFMSNYVGELDTDIAAVFALLHHGLELSFFTATDTGDADRLKSECTNRMTTIRDTLFKNYPYLMQYFKQLDYDSGAVWEIGHNWSFYATYNYMVINDFFCRQLALANSGTRRVFAVKAASGGDGDPFKAVELHAYWKDSSGNSRVGIYDGMPDGITHVKCFTNTARYAGNILFKIVPTKEPPINNVCMGWLVPFHQGTTSGVGSDDRDAFDYPLTWIWEDYDV